MQGECDPKPGGETSAVQIWQEKLIRLLAKQFNEVELKPIASSYASKLREDFPELPQDDWDSIARYLVTGQGDRYRQIAQFLSVAQKYAIEPSAEEPIKKVMAYLLQILVRKCHEETDKGLSHVPVDNVKSVKLVAAARTTVPHIPVDSGTLEHENGQKNEQFRNMGIFIPETGQLQDVNEICQVIVNELLKGLEKEPDTNDKDAFKTLKSQLKAYSPDPENAPVQGLYVKKGVGHNPLQRDDVAEAVAANLREKLGDFLWIYIYGGQDSSQWLYAEEDDIDGLISRYHRDVVKQKPAQQNPAQESSKNPAIKTAHSVLVSYSHDNRMLVSDLVTLLEKEGIPVVIDDTHLQSGEDIAAFIHRSIQETRATICIVSRASLLSTWVAMETVNTFHNEQWFDSKKFIACFLEDDFFKPAFRLEATKMIDEKIDEINALIPEYNQLKIDTNDLNEDKTRLIKLRNELGSILQRLKNSLSLDIRPENWETSLARLCKDLKME